MNLFVEEASFCDSESKGGQRRTTVSDILRAQRRRVLGLQPEEQPAQQVVLTPEKSKRDPFADLMNLNGSENLLVELPAFQVATQSTNPRHNYEV